jgi:hypothetical protein
MKTAFRDTPTLDQPPLAIRGNCPTAEARA